MKNCDDCRNYVWGDDNTPLPRVCIECKYIEVNGKKEPSNWKQRPRTNAERIRAMTDDELIALLKEFSAFSCIFPDKDCEEASCVECVTNWLKEIAEEE